MQRKLFIIVLAFALLLGQISAFGQGIQMPFYYTDHMVLQRGTEVPVVGKAAPGKTVTISLTKAKRPLQLVKAKADKDGNFRAEFKPIKEGGPYVIGIREGKNYIEFSDVMIGDVYLCSGQSNMAFTLKQAQDGDVDIANSKDDNLRLFMMNPKLWTNDQAWSQKELDAINNGDYWNPTSWKLSDPSSSADFSAIGWYFGKILQTELKVPIGIICNAVGGTRTESFIDKISLMTACPDIFYHNGVNELVPYWITDQEETNIALAKDKNTQAHPFKPSVLYSLGIEPIKDFPVKAVLWYQGESNATDVPLHNTLFKTLVNSWRKAWNNPNLPFYTVQLSSLESDNWAEFRNSQRVLAEEMENIEYVVCSDLGDKKDIHPTRKEPVGYRLARLALNKAYGENVEYSGPTPNNVSVINIVNGSKEIMISYKHANGLRTSDGKDPGIFEISVDDEKTWIKTVARIEGTNIVLSVPAGLNVPYDVKIRYAWQNYSEGNLVNSEGFPASTWKN